MEKHQLSKSTFIRGKQCLKSLYLHKKRPYLRDRISAEQLAKFKRGTNIGILAQDLFPGGINLKPKAPSQYQKCVAETKIIINNNENDIIYEAGFQYNGVLILLDLLVKKDGKWHAYEVKSSLSLSETYFFDAALQYYIIQNSEEIDLESFNLIYVDPEYEMTEKLDLHKFFKTQDVTQQLLPIQKDISKLIYQEKKVLSAKQSPQIDIGPQCNHPYPCDFQGLCWKNIKTNSIFELIGIKETEAFNFYSKGKIYISDLKLEDLNTIKSTNALQSFLIKKEIIDNQKLQKYLNNITNEYYFITIESFNQAIPKFEKSKAYDPFFFILQITPSSSSEYPLPYIFSKDEDSRQQIRNIFHETFLQNNNSIVCYDKDVIINCLNQIKTIDQSQSNNNIIENIEKRLIDFRSIFENNLFYHYSFKKNLDIFSTSKVLAKARKYKKPDLRSPILLYNEYVKWHETENVTEKENFFQTLVNYSNWKTHALRQFLTSLNNYCK
ncbi:MAG: DUF2779 domain-containing protein [Bacteroidales bacterium]